MFSRNQLATVPCLSPLPHLLPAEGSSCKKNSKKLSFKDIINHVTFIPPYGLASGLGRCFTEAGDPGDRQWFPHTGWRLRVLSSSQRPLGNSHEPSQTLSPAVPAFTPSTTFTSSIFVEVIQIITFVKERKKASLFAIQSIGYEKTTTHTHTHTLLQVIHYWFCFSGGPCLIYWQRIGVKPVSHSWKYVLKKRERNTKLLSF